MTLTNKQTKSFHQSETQQYIGMHDVFTFLFLIVMEY